MSRYYGRDLFTIEESNEQWALGRGWDIVNHTEEKLSLRTYGWYMLGGEKCYDRSILEDDEVYFEDWEYFSECRRHSEYCKKVGKTDFGLQNWCAGCLKSYSNLFTATADKRTDYRHCKHRWNHFAEQNDNDESSKDDNDESSKDD